MAERDDLPPIAARALHRPVRFVDRDEGGYWCWAEDDYFLGHVYVESIDERGREVWRPVRSDGRPLLWPTVDHPDLARQALIIDRNDEPVPFTDHPQGGKWCWDDQGYLLGYIFRDRFWRAVRPDGTPLPPTPLNSEQKAHRLLLDDRADRGMVPRVSQADEPAPQRESYRYRRSRRRRRRRR